MTYNNYKDSTVSTTIGLLTINICEINIINDYIFTTPT